MVKTELRTPDPEDTPHAYVSMAFTEGLGGPCHVCGRGSGHHIHDVPETAPETNSNTPHPFKHGGFHGFPTVCGTCGHTREHHLHHIHDVPEIATPAPGFCVCCHETYVSPTVSAVKDGCPECGHHILAHQHPTHGVPESDHDPVNHPAHYTAHPSGVEVIQITEHLGFCLGNVVKYVLRAEHKGSPIEDLEKAAWYLRRDIERRKGSL